MKYTEFFQFYLHTPIAVFEDLTTEQVTQDCYESSVIPLNIISDIKHPLFKKLKLKFKKLGVTQELKMLVIVIGYNKPYLS